MAAFFGEFEAKLDNKGRLRLPSRLTAQLNPSEGVAVGSESAPLILNRGFEKCLILYPQPEWQAMMARLESLNQFVQKNRDFVRYFLRGATEITLDTADRLLLPRTLQEYAAIDTDVVLLAYFDKIEIWAKNEYDRFMSQEPANFGELAEEILG